MPPAAAPEKALIEDSLMSKMVLSNHESVVTGGFVSMYGGSRALLSLTGDMMICP